MNLTFLTTDPLYLNRFWLEIGNQTVLLCYDQNIQKI